MTSVTGETIPETEINFNCVRWNQNVELKMSTNDFLPTSVNMNAKPISDWFWSQKIFSNSRKTLSTIPNPDL